MEEKSDAHARALDRIHAELADIRTQIGDLRRSFDTQIAGVRAEIAAVRTEVRAEISTLRLEMERRFAWTLGIMFTGFGAIIAAIAGVYWQLFQIAAKLQGG